MQIHVDRSYYKQALIYFLVLTILCLGLSMSGNAWGLTYRIPLGKRLGDRPRADGTIIWNGFHHYWENTPHRLNRFGSYFRNIEYARDDDVVFGERRSIFKVGQYNDEGTVRIKGQFVRSGVLGIHHGYVKEDCLRVKGKVGQAASITCEVSVDLRSIRFKRYDQVTVVLRGFQITETSYESGYNTRGFAVRVIPVDRNRDTFEFDVYFKIHPEHAPDRPLPSWFPLGDSCGKCDTYSYEARVYYTLVGVKNESGNLVDAPEKGTNHFSQYVKMSPNKTPHSVSKATRTAVIYGEPDFDHGIVAIQGIAWQLKDWKGTKKDGRYIRELKFDVANREYDWREGKASFTTNMYFSNSGLIPRGFSVSFTMWNALIQLNDARLVVSPPTWYRGKLAKGQTSLTSPVSYGF